MNRTRVCVSGAVFLFTALMLLILPLKWLTAAIVAAVWHEFCHWLAVKLCGGTVSRIAIGGRGAIMEAEPMSPGRELVCALAGPVGGLTLMFFAGWIPRIALCAVIQSLYNLLPIFPLDGGRVLRCGAAIAFPPKQARRCCVFWERVVKVLVVLLTIYGIIFLKLGLLPLFPAVLILFQTNSEKSLAN